MVTRRVGFTAFPPEYPGEDQTANERRFRAAVDAAFTTTDQNFRTLTQAVVDYTDPRFVKVEGDTMTGPLILSGKPTEPRGAATKSYVGVSNYDVTVSYQFDELVAYEGSVYHCVTTGGTVPGPFNIADWSPIAGIAVGGTNLDYRWTNNTAGPIPSGRFGVNNADPALATVAFVSSETNPGNDASLFWQNIRAGDFFGFIEGTGGAEYAYYLATGPAVMTPGTPDWWSIPANVIDTDGDPENNRQGTVTIVGDPSARFPPGGLTGQSLVKNSDTSYDAIWRDLIETDVTDLDRVRPRGNFVLGNTYLKNDQALQNGYMGVALVDTQDNLAPLPQGDAAYVYEGSSPTSAITAKSLLVGTEYTFPEAFIMKRYRVYTITGNEYVVYYSVDGGITQTLISFTASTTGWLEQPTNEPIVAAGSVLNLAVVVREPDPTPTEFTLSYNYVKPNNPAIPIAGEITHSTKSLDVLDVNKTDQNGDQSAQLAGMEIGDVIETGNTRWSISAIVDNGTYYSFTVAPAIQAAGSGVMDFNFETVTATPITTVVDPDYFLGSADVQPFYIIDNGVRVDTDDALGIDIELQSVIVSPDWFIYAVSGASASSGDNGGGASSFTELNDTPASYVGQNFNVPRVDEANNQLVFEDFTTFFVLSTGGTFTGPVNFNNAGQDQIRLNNKAITQPFAHVLRATNDGDFGLAHGDTGTLGGIIESPNDNLKDGLSLVTRAKGDARYLEAIDSGAVDFDTLVPPSTQVQNYRITAVPTANGYPGAGVGDWLTTYAYSGTAARQVGQNWNVGDNDPVYYRDKTSGTWGEWIAIGSGGGGGSTTIVEADVGVNAGWQVWGDTLVQWGTVPARGNTDVFTITFDQAFETTPSISFVSDGAGNRSVGIEGGITATAATGVALKIASEGTQIDGTVRWMAVGEAPDALKKPKVVSGGGGGGGGYHWGETEPVDANVGDYWYCSLAGFAGLYVLTDDGDSTQWVQTNSGGKDGTDGTDGTDGATGGGWTNYDGAATWEVLWDGATDANLTYLTALEPTLLAWNVTCVSSR